MKPVKTLLVPAASAILFAGCALGTQNGVPSQSAAQLSPAALTMRHYAATVVHPDHSALTMRSDAKSAKGLIYAGDWSTNDVYVYDYSNGKQVGTLTGFDDPYGGCVDAKGDVYIANFGNGTTVEYAHGGTKVLNTYSPGGEPMGCTLDAKGDLAITSFNPGEVTVFAGGDPQKGTIYSDTNCEYQWAMTYDNNDDLIGVGEDTRIDICALLRGSKSEQTLSAAGITIDFPGGSTWDGKYIALGDQESGGRDQSGYTLVSLSGSTLTVHGQVTLIDNCYSNYVDIINPFVVGKKNTPVNHHEGSVFVGSNGWCSDPGIEFWHWPQGGAPYKTYPLDFGTYGVVVSLKA